MRAETKEGNLEAGAGSEAMGKGVLLIGLILMNYSVNFLIYPRAVYLRVSTTRNGLGPFKSIINEENAL